jgi:hypothetical protein
MFQFNTVSWETQNYSGLEEATGLSGHGEPGVLVRWMPRGWGQDKNLGSSGLDDRSKTERL